MTEIVIPALNLVDEFRVRTRSQWSAYCPRLGTRCQLETAVWNWTSSGRL